MKRSVLSLAGTAAKILPTWVKRSLYRIPWLARMVRGGLNRAAPQGITEVVVAAGPLAGMRMCLDLQAEKEFWLGTYEPELQSALMEVVKPGMVAYDVGANIGYFTLLLAKRVGAAGKVYAFEALPSNVARLERNIALNGLESWTEVVPAAVVDHLGPVDFMLGPSGRMGKVEGASGRQAVAYQEKITIEGTSLDDFIAHDNHPAPEAVKMDIEGGEVLALPGMQQILERAKPVMFLELHGEEAAQAAWKVLTERGYRIASLQKGYPEIASLQSLAWKAYILATPK